MSSNSSRNVLEMSSKIFHEDIFRGFRGQWQPWCKLLTEMNMEIKKGTNILEKLFQPGLPLRGQKFEDKNFEDFEDINFLYLHFSFCFTNNLYILFYGRPNKFPPPPNKKKAQDVNSIYSKLILTEISG